MMSEKLALKVESQPLKPQDFASDQEVRWCPGCGDYAILKTMQKVLAQLAIPKEDLVFVSGIGCASRFPYYLDTYGFHTIHGRAPCLATGVKLANPNLSVWVITGDGDGLSIGSNHLIHLMRRNINVNILLFNNKIYGLTKGQYSPTSEVGLKTKSSPNGALEAPLNPVQLALAAQCGFVARGIDIDANGLPDVMLKAAQHEGTSFVEIYQNCHVFNDGAFGHVRDKVHRDVNTITLTPGQPLLFGKNNEKGLIVSNDQIIVKDIQSQADLNDITIYQSSMVMAIQMAQLKDPSLPTPIGVFYQEQRPTYDSQVCQQISHAKQHTSMSFEDVLMQGHHWEVK